MDFSPFHAAQVLKAPCPQIATLLDLRCITAMGVTKGSSLRFAPLADLPMRFGSGLPAGSAGAAAAVAEEEANMEALAEALKDREEAEQRHQIVQKVQPFIDSIRVACRMYSKPLPYCHSKQCAVSVHAPRRGFQGAHEPC